MLMFGDQMVSPSLRLVAPPVRATVALFFALASVEMASAMRPCRDGSQVAASPPVVGGHPQARDARRGHHQLADLLLHREAGNEVIDPFFQGQVGVPKGHCRFLGAQRAGEDKGADWNAYDAAGGQGAGHWIEAGSDGADCGRGWGDASRSDEGTPEKTCSNGRPNGPVNAAVPCPGAQAGESPSTQGGHVYHEPVFHIAP
jgi:hypothetical protein